MQQPRQTYLVTGAAGFIGAAIAQALLQEGHAVVGADNLDPYYDLALKHHRLAGLQAHAEFQFYELDLAEPAAAEFLVAQAPYAAVFHMAARAGVRHSLRRPADYYAANVRGLLNLLEALQPEDTRKIIQASSSSLYAGQAGPFHEGMPTDRPTSPYAASKKAAEELLFTYHHLYDFDVSVLRYFTVYGPAGRPDMSVLRFLRWIVRGEAIQLYGDGYQQRDFTYISDIVAGTLAARRPLGYEVINLGGGGKLSTIQSLIDQLGELLNATPAVDYQPASTADMPLTWADNTKAAELLGWAPQVALSGGLARTVAWYRANRELVEGLRLQPSAWTAKPLQP